MSNGPIVAVPETYGGAAADVPLSPAMPSPPPPPNQSPFGAAAAAFGAIVNSDVPSDNTEVTGSDVGDRAAAADAAGKFPEGELGAVSDFEQLGAGGLEGKAGEMFPQMISGVAGGVAGAVGGVLGPLTQLPQGVMQAGQGAFQAGLGALQQGVGGSDADLLSDMSDDDLADLLMSDPSMMDASLTDFGGGDGGGAGGVDDVTSPTGVMGPPPVPMSSAPTTPAAAPAKPVPIAPVSSGASPGTPMGGGMMPMVPPGMGAGAGAGADKGKADEKRIAAPGVPNGQPVKGRMTVPPSVPVTKTVASKESTPVEAKTGSATVRKRVVPKAETDPKDA